MNEIPGWTRVLIRLFVSKDRREDVSGDLVELHALRVEQLGAFKAWWVTSYDAWIVTFTLFIYGLKEGTDMGNWITWLDIKLALRLIRKRPLLNLTALLALTTGIGVANTGFTVLDAMVFSQLPYEAGDRFIGLHAYEQDGRRTSLTPTQLQELVEHADSLAFLGGKQHQRFYLSHDDGDVESVTGAGISPDAFRFLPARPLVGRPLGEADGELNAPPVALIRESLWSARYGRNPEVIGATLNVSGTDRTVVGVLPDTFEFPNSPRVWIPIENQSLGAAPHEKISSRIELFGIRNQDVDLSTVQNELSRLSTRFEASNPAGLAIELRVRPYTQEGDPRQLWTIMGSFLLVLTLVLLVLAANVGNLVMVRTATRTSELAVRSALGAGRRRLIGQLFVEVALLVSLATVLSYSVSTTGLSWFRSTFTEAPFWLEFSPSPRTALASAVAAFLATMAAGLGPALKATRPDSNLELKAGGRGMGGMVLGRLASTMTVLQMAVSVALVSTALIIAHGAMSYMDSGLDLPRAEILTVQTWAKSPSPDGNAGRDGDSETWRNETLLAGREAMLKAIEGMPGVTAVGGASSLPGDSTGKAWAQIEPDSEQKAPSAISIPIVSVLPNFMETLDVKPIAGRFIREQDLDANAPRVAVVNELFVKKFFEGRNPIGRRIRALPDRDESPSPWHEIVGVAPDLGLNITNPDQSAGYYVPMKPGRGAELVIRVHGDPASYTGSLRKAVAEVDPGIRLIRIQPLEEVTSEAALMLTLFGGGLSLLGSAALMLSLVGMFTLTSLTVSQRTREIGLRIALGATAKEILILVSRRALTHLSIGTAIGSILAIVILVATRTLESGLPMGRPWELPGVALMLALTAIAACWWPARRALRISPSEALSDD